MEKSDKNPVSMWARASAEGMGINEYERLKRCYRYLESEGVKIGFRPHERMVLLTGPEFKKLMDYYQKLGYSETRRKKTLKDITKGRN